jgi:hypothetical protein
MDDKANKGGSWVAVSIIPGFLQPKLGTAMLLITKQSPCGYARLPVAKAAEIQMIMQGALFAARFLYPDASFCVTLTEDRRTTRRVPGFAKAIKAVERDGMSTLREGGDELVRDMWKRHTPNLLNVADRFEPGSYAARIAHQWAENYLRAHAAAKPVLTEKELTA